MIKTSKRSEIAPFMAMDMMQAASEFKYADGKVLRLEVGQPSTSAPKLVLERARQALEEDKLGYTNALGEGPLRERIAQHYQDFYKLDIQSKHVVVTTGSSAGFMLAFLSVFDAGDKVAITCPGYSCYRNILTTLNLEPLEVPVDEETRFQWTVDLLKNLKQPIDDIILTSPANPTGTMMDPKEMEAVLDYCQQKGIRVISDEVYHGITYEQPAISALKYSKDVLVINSFSKYFCMTGWRLGWLVVPDNLVRCFERLGQNLFISPPTLAQMAAVAAFESYDELNTHVARYTQNRDILIQGLKKSGLSKIAPADGAFYLYVDISEYSQDSQSFCRTLLYDRGIAMTPGVDFDRERGHHSIRLSYCGPTEDMVTAADRLRLWSLTL